MDLIVKGKHMDVGDALRTYIDETLKNGVKKYFPNTIEAVVNLSKERHLYIADISIHAGHNVMIQASSEANEPYPAVDLAVKKIEARLNKHKNKLKDHHKNADKQEFIAASQYIIKDEDQEAPGTDPVIVAEMEHPVETLTVGDAVMRMELAELPALLFKNKLSGAINMVYKRSDGNVGWVDPTNRAKK